MATDLNQLDTMILEAALYGLRRKREAIEAQIVDVQRALKARHTNVLSRSLEPESDGSVGTQRLSDEGRRRIAEAQRKRWAQYRRRKKR